jgi:ABC-type transport system involved in cytochrome bd biosynthesis fused ATPase/permease subunit
LTAILGASGAGKTSLLNIIAKRVSHGGNITLEGSLLANGRPYTSEKFTAFASLVM